MDLESFHSKGYRLTQYREYEKSVIIEKSDTYSNSTNQFSRFTSQKHKIDNRLQSSSIFDAQKSFKFNWYKLLREKGKTQQEILTQEIVMK